MTRARRWPRWWTAALVALATALAWGCADDAADDDDADGVHKDDDADDDAADDDDADDDADDDDTYPPYDGPCEFAYAEEFDDAARDARVDAAVADALPVAPLQPGAIVHADPPPPSVTLWRPDPTREIVMPDYVDDMPLFERAVDWAEDELRCFELPSGAAWLSEDDAYDLYRDVAELTTGVPIDDSPGRRTVIGLRGAYPGTFAWHGNEPDRFNDTLVLLWIDGEGRKQVREHAAHTDVGDYDFGVDSSSFLRPNRRYEYTDGWHHDYNALAMDEWGYTTRDDTNHNGHWDSDRNGWLPPDTGDDHDRIGSGHNIHMASVDAPLGSASVRNWSAGCQVIPGMASWEAFIEDAWTEEGDPVDYQLVDVRDIAPQVWSPCTPDGTHECPYPIDSWSFRHDGDTAAATSAAFDLYNCSDADERGPEVVYVLTVDDDVTIDARVDCDDPDVDVDVHLLDADDPDACLARGHWDLSHSVGPGRYVVIVDTWFDGLEALAGEYTLWVDIH